MLFNRFLYLEVYQYKIKFPLSSNKFKLTEQLISNCNVLNETKETKEKTD